MPVNNRCFRNVNVKDNIKLIKELLTKFNFPIVDQNIVSDYTVDDIRNTQIFFKYLCLCDILNDIKFRTPAELYRYISGGLLFVQEIQNNNIVEEKKKRFTGDLLEIINLEFRGLFFL